MSSIDYIKTTINELEQTINVVPKSIIDDETQIKIDELLNKVKEKMNNSLNEYNKKLLDAQQEDERNRVKQEYINFLKRDIFLKLNTHIPIGSYVYHDYDELELTPEQQIVLYEHVFENLNTMLNELRGTPNMDRNLISELALAIYSWGTSKLSIVSLQLKDVVGKSVQLSRKTIAVIASIQFLYNRLPNKIRNSFETIPFIGSIFKIANNIQPITLGVQNTLAIGGSIYMTLKSGGIDPQLFIQSVLNECQSTGKRVRSQLTSIIGNVCSRILRLFEVNFDDEITVKLTQYSQEVDNFQIPLLSYSSYSESNNIMTENLSARQVTDNLNDLLTQLNNKLNVLETDVNELSQELLTPPSLPSNSSQESLGGRKHKRKTHRRRKNKSKLYKKRKHTTRKGRRKSIRHRRR